MFKNYLRIAFRNLLKYKSISFINISGLAIGLSCCILILSFVQMEWSYDSFHKNKDRLYRVVNIQKRPDGSLKKVAIQPLPMRNALLDEFPEVKDATRFLESEHNIIKYNEKTFDESIMFVDIDFFRMFKFPLISGSPETVLSEPNNIVLTESVSKKYFGTQNPMGQLLFIDIDGQRYEYKVNGVVKDISQNSSIRFNLLCPITGYPSIKNPLFAENWNSSNVQLYIELKQGTSNKELENKLFSLVQKYMVDRVHESQSSGTLSMDKDAWALHLQPITNIHMATDIRFGMIPTGNPVFSYILTGIALIVLLIACINFMTLAVGHSIERAREVGIRKTFGAFRSQLMMQFWSEALLQTALSLIIALCVVELFLPLFNQLIGVQVTLSYFGSWITIVILFSLLCLVAFIAGSYPAILLSGFRPVEALKNTSVLSGLKISKNSFSLRKILVVLQYGISIVFIISTLIMINQMDYINNKDLGFNKNLMLSISTYSNEAQSIEVVKRFKTSLQDNSAILDVSSGTFTFNEGWSRQDWKVNGQLHRAYAFRVDYDYLKTLQLKLKEGRFFSRDFPGDQNNSVVVNEALVRELGLKEPVIGSKLKEWGNILDYETDPTIIGVVKNYNYRSLYEPVEPAVLHINSRWPLRYLFVRISSKDIPGAIALLENTFRKVKPDSPFEYSFVDKDLNNQYLSDQNWENILTYSSIFTNFIASMGLFGLALFDLRRRTKEIGIRKILGAKTGNIIVLMLKDFIILLVIANIIAWPVAYYLMNKWLQNFVYKINISLWIFLTASVITFFIVLATISYHAIKAATSNPVEALRYE